MLLTTTIVTFLATTVVVLAIIYGVSGATQPVAGRLAHLWHASHPAAQRRFRDEQKERAQKMLADVGKLLPASPKNVSRTQRLLIRAGYRKPEAVTIFRGAKTVFFVSLVSLVYFSGYYKESMASLAFAMMAGFLLPDIWLSRRIRRRQHRIRLALPDALDLLVVCVEAGLGLDQSLMRVSEELRIAHPELSEELQLVNLEIRVGKTRMDALRELSARTGVDDIQSLVAMLIQTERFGTSIARSLRVHSDNLRTKRRQRAEEQAAKTPVKMVPVLVFFIFPALFVVILGPAVISLARQLLPILER